MDERPDMLAFETIPDIVECSAIVALLKELPNDTPPAWISLACRDSSHLNDGSAVVDALDAICKGDPCANYVAGIGVNCCSYEFGKYHFL